MAADGAAEAAADDIGKLRGITADLLPMDRQARKSDTFASKVTVVPGSDACSSPLGEEVAAMVVHNVAARGHDIFKGVANLVFI